MARSATVEALAPFSRAVLTAAGADEPSAEAATWAMLHASLHGVDSHGIRLLPWYADCLRNGIARGAPNVTVTHPRRAVALVDADNGLGHIAMGGAWAHYRNACLQRLPVDRKGVALCLAGLAHHQGSTDLRVVTVRARCELGGHQIAGGKTALASGVHAAQFGAARAQDHEVFWATLAAKPGFHIGHQLEFPTPHPSSLFEDCIAFVGQSYAACQGVGFLQAFVHHQGVQHGRARRQSFA